MRRTFMLLAATVTVTTLSCWVPVVPVVGWQEADVKPVPARLDSPVYPAEAVYAGMQGTVLVRALIDVDGIVLTAEVERSSGYPLLDKAALRAALESVFTAALVGGNPVRIWVSIPYVFSLSP